MLEIIDINLLGLVIYQTLAFAVLFLFLISREKNVRSLPFLSLLFFTSFFYQFYILLFYRKVEFWTSALTPLFQLAILLLLPTAFYYVKSMTSEHFKPKDFYQHLIIPFILFIVYLYFYFKIPAALRDDTFLQKHVHNSPSVTYMFIYFTFCSIFVFSAQAAYYITRTLQLIHNYKTLVRDYLSSEENKNIMWAYNLPILIFLLYFLVIFNILFFTQYSVQIRILFSIIQFIGVTYWGIHGTMAISLIELKSRPILIPVPLDQHRKNSSLIRDKIHDLMIEYEHFKDIDFSLGKLAQITNMNPSELSLIINKEFGANFFTFVNSYRINEAKRRLEFAKDIASLSMAGVGMECGFKSKATFYRVFKNATGMAPKEYMLKNKKASQ